MPCAGAMNGLFAKLSMTEIRSRPGLCAAAACTKPCHKVSTQLRSHARFSLIPSDVVWCSVLCWCGFNANSSHERARPYKLAVSHTVAVSQANCFPPMSSQCRAPPTSAIDLRMCVLPSCRDALNTRLWRRPVQTLLAALHLHLSQSAACSPGATATTAAVQVETIPAAAVAIQCPLYLPANPRKGSAHRVCTVAALSWTCIQQRLMWAQGSLFQQGQMLV